MLANALPFSLVMGPVRRLNVYGSMELTSLSSGKSNACVFVFQTVATISTLLFQGFYFHGKPSQCTGTWRSTTASKTSEPTRTAERCDVTTCWRSFGCASLTVANILVIIFSRLYFIAVRMTVREGQRHLSCSVNRRGIDSMEVVDSPLNLVSVGLGVAITS